MVDCKIFAEKEPNYKDSFLDPASPRILSPPPRPVEDDDDGLNVSTEQAKTFDTVPEQDLVLCSPTVFGYAFRVKNFGKMPVHNLFPINWDSGTVTELVLPEPMKEDLKKEDLK